MKLIIDNLTCKRGGRIIFHQFNQALNPGESLLLTGANGCGKTSLIRTIAGFLHADQGRIELEEKDKDREFGEYFHYIGHLNGIRTSLTVRENMEFWCRFFGSSTDKISDTIQSFHLTGLDHIPAGYMSAGQKRRLGLSRLMLVERQIWLLDEPTVSLDKESSAFLGDLISTHLSEGGMAIAATHIPMNVNFTHKIEMTPYDQPFEEANY